VLDVLAVLGLLVVLARVRYWSSTVVRDQSHTQSRCVFMVLLS
jgi:hypothetical protein